MWSSTELDSFKSDADDVFRGVLHAVEGRNFADPHECVQLPFPAIRMVPDCFQISPAGIWTYMGRPVYGDVRRTLLSLCTKNLRHIMNLPVTPDQVPAYRHMTGALWGTMGSGKSFILAALACELLATFYKKSRRRSDRDGKDLQVQRVFYLPDCSEILDSAKRADYVKSALLISYSDDEETIRRIAMLSDDDSLKTFFMQESGRGVRLYLIVDQDNAFDQSDKDDAEMAESKGKARRFIASLAVRHPILRGASANNINARRWKGKQDNITKVFLYGGLDEEEYRCWRQHFGTPRAAVSHGGAGAGAKSDITETPLPQLSEEEELRVRDATGCVPLFLQCWSRLSEPAKTSEQAWNLFVNLPEVDAASYHLREQIENQLCDPAHRQTRLHMYRCFMTESPVRADPMVYDCRYLYIDVHSIGRCVCGVFRNLIAEALQHLERGLFLQPEWKGAISREVTKPNPNPAVLGFLVEQEMLAQIWQNGIPLYAETVKTCDNIVYFLSGTETNLELQEGCTLYVPSAFNYHRVDAIVRKWRRMTPGKRRGVPKILKKMGKNKTSGGGKFAQVDRCRDADPIIKQMLKSYKERPLHVAGVQITLGSLSGHLNSENEFCSPAVMDAWCTGFDKEDVARWFVWYVWQSQIDDHAQGTVDLDSYHYATGEIRGKTRVGNVQQLDHITVFLPVEQFEPSLKKRRIDS